MKKILVIFMVCLAGGLVQYCCTGCTGPGDEVLLKSLLMQPKLSGNIPDGSYFIVSPKTTFFHSLLDVKDKEIEQTACKLKEIAKNMDCNFEELLRELIERNRQRITLTVKSDPSNGYLIDYKGEFDTHNFPNWGEWRKWKEKNPNVIANVSLSLPVYNPDSHIILVYSESEDGPWAASGGLVMYKYENGKVTHTGGMALWIS